MDLLNVVIRADTTGADRSTAALDKMTAGARQADAAIKSLGQTGGAGLTQFTRAAEEAAAAQNRLAAASRASVHRTAGLATQLADIGQMLALGQAPMITALQQGPQIFSMYGNSIAGLGQAFKDMGALALGAARALLGPFGLTLSAVIGGLAGLTHQINETGETQVNMLDVMLSGWQLFSEGVASSVAPVFGALGSWLQQGWDAAVPVLKAMGNAIINTSNAISIVWQTWPAIMGDAIISTVNVALTGITSLLNEARAQVLQFMDFVSTLPIPGVAQLAGAAVGVSTTPFTAPQFSNPFQGTMGGVGSAIADTMGQDPLGNAFTAISSRAQQIARARAEAEALDGAANSANASVAKLLDQGLGDLTHWTQSFGDAAWGAFQNLGSGIVAAFKKGGDVASNVLDMLMDKVGQFGETLLNNGLNGLLSMGLNALGGMFGGGTWGVAGGFMAGTGMPGIFGIPGMAEGGTVGRSGLSWVGEQGPELLRLPQGAQVIPNGPSMAMAANQNQNNDNGGMTVIIEKIEASSYAAGAAAAQGFQDGMKQWKQSGEGARYIRNVVGQGSGRANPR